MQSFRLFFVAASLGIAGAAAAGAKHPLDGLTLEEYEIVAEVLIASKRTDKTTHIAEVNLVEPDKQSVLSFRPGDPLDRHAFIALRQQKELYEIIIDLNSREIESWEKIDGAQPHLMGIEWMMSQAIVRSDMKWREAVAKRGVDFKQVFCFPVFPGYFDLPRDKENRRLGMVSCYDAGHENGLWGRPLAGLLAIVDYDARKIAELIDKGVVPIPDGGPKVEREQPTAMPASGPAERRFAIEDNWITWDKWRFHLRIDPRVGPVLSQVSIDDKGRRRSVMYQGYISEMFVPYMDPTQNWYFRTYLDVGEYGIGISGVPLRAGTDCPADSALIDVTFMSELGKIFSKPDVICVFERVTGDAAWSHFEVTQEGSQLRRRTELVVRFIVWLGNYDYLLDWVFDETGTLKGRVSSTGIVQIRGVKTQDMADKSAAEDTAYGRLIAPGTVAVNHDHYFGFRLDLDVDGTENNLVVDRLRTVNLDPEDLGTPRKQIWQIFSEMPDSEADAKLNVDLARPAVWRVANPNATNHVGNQTSYQLVPGGATRALMNSEEIAHRRAGYTDYNLWVTPYKLDERYAAGKYPSRHPGNAGLPTWTAGNRSIRDRDIVLWYTIGMHHAVRAEDWPIMPVVQKEFELRPFDFFDYNPTVTGN